MLVTIVNISGSLLSTDIGLLQPGETKSQDMSPRQLYLSAAAFKSMEDSGKIRLSVSGEAALADKMESAVLHDQLNHTGAKIFQYDNLAAADTTSVAANFMGNAATLIFGGVITNPAVPRSLVVNFEALWTGGDIIIVGTDQFDNEQSETFPSNPGGAHNGSKVFKTVTQISRTVLAGAAKKVDVGRDNLIGVSAPIAAGYMLLLQDTNAFEAAAAYDTTVCAFTPTTAPNGVHDYKLLANLATTQF